jgi:hypothetical protein
MKAVEAETKGITKYLHKQNMVVQRINISY